MTSRGRPTPDDIVAARHQITRVHARLRDEGEGAVIADIWGAVVDDVAGFPEVHEALKLVKRAHRPSHTTADVLRPADDEEAIHRAVVELVQETQRTADELTASGDRAERRT